MFADYVFETLADKYADKILLVDIDHLNENTHFSDGFKARGFEIVMYQDDLTFRIEYEEKIKSKEGRIAVIVSPEQYVPYDIMRRLTSYAVSLADLFPRLNTSVLREGGTDILDLVSSAYKRTYDQYSSASATELFILSDVFSKDNIRCNLEQNYHEVLLRSAGCTSYKDWFGIAEDKARIDCIAAEYDLNIDTTEINRSFLNYILTQYKKLSTCIDSQSPVLVSKAMDFMHEQSKKYVIIVMDGMSEFDWHILSKSFSEIIYRKTSAFAMIPTVTSISRQCLLSNKFPRELDNPWSQNKEKNEFITCAKNMGFSENQISYQRGYEAEFSSTVRCGAVIINDIDDMVHGQKQGRIGMFNDMKVMEKQNKLAAMTKRLLAAGFDVYITADHGNTPRKGIGKLMTTGVETETKSRCMIVLKGFADKEGIKDKYGLIDFPKIYLPKEYDYLICDIGYSFDAKCLDVMTHGGISIDECIVPFITIKADENNG